MGIFLIGVSTHAVTLVSAEKLPLAPQKIYLPLVMKQTPALSARRVNAPTFDGTWFGGNAIFWFGKVTLTQNYTDVRVGYTSTDLYVRLTVFDRRIWCNTNSQATDPTLWDSVIVYLDTSGNSGNAPTSTAFRFLSQFTNGVMCVNGNWANAYQGNGTSWASKNISFSVSSWYRGPDGAGPNTNADNQGWVITFRFPFTSVGAASPPTQGTTWGLGLTLYDRDDSTGTPIPSQSWPETFVADRSSTWGQLVFGLPSAYTPAPSTPRSIETIRNGVNGAVVTDGEVGGHTTCGNGMTYFWSQWGETNYAGAQQINVQNQEDVADWPCFSKFYITFPLNSIPAGKVIVSSTLTMYQFGNSGQGWNPGPYPSLIQVQTVSNNWNEATLTWNNAPLASEFVSETTVSPFATDPPWPGVPRNWDVSSAVAKAYATGIPLRLVLYSADRPMHSGKYFYSSDASAEARPILQVLWGDP